MAQPPIIQLRISDNDPYTYIQPSTAGSVVIGTDASDSNKLKIVISDAIDNLDPSSGTASLSIDPSTNGNITVSPKGVGETIIANGDLAISAGNLDMTFTSGGGTSGVISLGVPFAHNAGSLSAFIGENSGNFSNTGGENTGIGAFSLLNISSGNSNTAAGYGALSNATTAVANVAVGRSALFSSVSDTDNTAIGFNSLNAINGGIQNTAVGSGSLAVSNTDSGQTAIGYLALGALNGGIQNTAVGFRALSQSQTDSNNTAIGYNALSQLNGGFRNTAVGTNALAASTTDSNNTAIGYNALASMNGALVTGNSVAIGENCLASSVQDYSNIGIGLNALASLNGGGSFSNVAIGIQTLPSLTSGNNNMTMGYQTGYNLLTGHDNVMIGDNSGFHYTGAESNNILFNNLGVLGESNAIHIGTGSTTCFIAGINGVSVTAAGTVVIDSSGKLGTAAAFSTAWAVITIDQTAAINNGYICNKGSALLLALPASSVVGSIIEVTGINTALGWKVTQAAGQQIFFGNQSTTAGATGFLQSSAIRDSIKMVCVVADLTWNVISSVGNITVN